MIRSINSENFTASGMEIRSFKKEIIISVPIEEVFAAWTEKTAFRQAMDPNNPELSANIDLAIGGSYEWLFDGETGSNGCQILSYIPNRMISFSWNAPPHQPESRLLKTWVVVEVQPVDSSQTKLVLTHLGFGKEPHWDETFNYFDEAWGFVFNHFKKNLEEMQS